MNSQQSIVHTVRQHVARNPIARAIERQRLQQYFTRTSLEMLTTQDGQRSDSLICGAAEAIAIAIKATEGWDDPADIGGALVGAMDLLLQMSKGGYLWQAASAAELVEALDYAIQIISGATPAEKMKAWAWAQQVERKAAAVAVPA